MSVENWIVVFLSGVVSLGFGYLLRLTDDRPLRWWAGAWGVFLLDNLLSVGRFASEHATADALLLHASYFTSPLIPFLLLGGALLYAERAIPRWLLPVAIGVAAGRTLLAAAGHAPVAQLVSLATEVPANAFASVIVLRVAQRRVRRAIPGLMAVGYAAIAVVEGALAASLYTQTRLPWLVFIATCVILTMAGLQLLAVLEGIDEGAQESRRLRARDMDLLRRIARASCEHTAVASLVTATLELLRAELPFDGLGVWLREDPGELVRVGGFGPVSGILSRVGSIPVDHPLCERVVRERLPHYGGSLQHEERVPPELRNADLGAYCLLPLCYGEEVIGVVTAMVRRGSELGPQDRTLLEAVVDELSVALRHAAMLEERAGHVAALEAERTRLRAVLETAPVGILMQDADARVAVLNRTCEEQIGIAREDWVGRPFVELAEAQRSRVIEPRGDERPASSPDGVIPNFEFGLRSSGGGLRTLELFTSPVRTPEGEALGRVWITRELTGERKLEEQLWQSQKFEALGQLAGGISHDFNNQLAAILGNARHLLRRVPDEEDELREVLEDVVLAADHCADLTRSLLAFSRRAPLARRRIEVPELLESARRLLRPLLPPSIELEIEPAFELPELEADPIQMQQVLVNLAINARDAMAERGRIRIGARLREGDVLGGTVDPRKPQRHLEIRVSDTGSGIPPEIQERIFEPFFTTKRAGEGTGLGLSTVFGVVQAHGGCVRLESEPGEGTTFRVALPLETDDPA